MKASLKQGNPKGNIEESAENRPLGRSLVSAGVLQYEENGTTAAEQNRLRAKEL